MFLSYCGIHTLDQGKTWFSNGIKFSSSKNSKYRVITTDYTRESTDFNDSHVTILKEYSETHTRSLINFLKMIFPTC